MENSQNDRISAMIAAGISPRDALAAVNATDAIVVAKAARDEYIDRADKLGIPRADAIRAYNSRSGGPTADDMREAARPAIERLAHMPDVEAELDDALDAARVDDALIDETPVDETSDLDRELAAERADLSEALKYGCMTQAEYDAEFDLVSAYTTIARDIGATIAQVRGTIKRAERNADIDARFDGYLNFGDAFTTQDAADDDTRLDPYSRAHEPSGKAAKLAERDARLCDYNPE